MTNRKSYLTVAALLAVVFVLAVSLGSASTFLKVDLPTLAKMSESVVQARVTNIESAWNAQRTIIFTHVTLDVIRTLHGKAEKQIIVRVPGGTVDGFTVEMEGAPKFENRSVVVVFIDRWDDGAAMAAGYFQGVSKIVQDRLGNQVLRGGVADGLTIAALAQQLAAAGGKP